MLELRAERTRMEENLLQTIDDSAVIEAQAELRQQELDGQKQVRRRRLVHFATFARVFIGLWLINTHGACAGDIPLSHVNVLGFHGHSDVRSAQYFFLSITLYMSYIHVCTRTY